MNQAQRTFLIKKIEEASKLRVRVMEDAREQSPSLAIYILHAVMSGKFEIQNTEKLKEIIRQRALKSTDRDREKWLGGNWGSTSSDVHFKLREFFVVPAEWQIRYDEWQIKDEMIQKEIRELKAQTDGLITRIQLASDKTLQTMINEVDDMGNISLMDTKLKLLTA